ncbi:hypothetical protein [Mycobacterium intracellulare]|uniref:hypothetical protein n=1 Tax=Mycobacterium intracellulare TaxID=1767 RepID=UPI00080B6BBB|nr:hypothetical protein [Mycobacterium intracellulare]OCB08089.1 hypothetical protein A5644_08000 [Mycobacterium intracellulare subsp. yongonense]
MLIATPGDTGDEVQAIMKSLLELVDRARTAIAPAGHAIVTVLLAVIGAVIAAWIYARFLRPRRDFAADNKVTAAHDRADNKKPAATVILTRSPKPWFSWLSDDVIDIPPDAERGMYNTRFPGHDRAIRTSMPYRNRTNGADLVRSTLSFDLTGTHYTATRVASFKAVIDQRRPVPTGTVYFAAPQGGGAKGEVAFDLGSPDLNARVQDKYGAPTTRHYLDEYTYDLVRGESIGFIAAVFAPRYSDDIRYHLEIAFDAGPPISIYNETGEPFRIVGYPRTARRAYFDTSIKHHDWPNYPHIPVDGLIQDIPGNTTRP